MVGEATKVRSEDLNLCFEKLMMVAGGNSGPVKMEGLPITEWKDIPMELLLRIASLVDDRTVIVASGVCSGWRDAICLGLTHLSLSWQDHTKDKMALSGSTSWKKILGSSVNLKLF